VVGWVENGIFMSKKPDPKEIEGKKLGLLVWSKDKTGDNDIRLFTGIIKWHDDRLCLKREEGFIPIPNEWFKKIKPVGKEVKSLLLDAEYYISLKIKDLLENEDVLKLTKLPIKKAVTEKD
jgi:hypothetical protein